VKRNWKIWRCAFIMCLYVCENEKSTRIPLGLIALFHFYIIISGHFIRRIKKFVCKKCVEDWNAMIFSQHITNTIFWLKKFNFFDITFFMPTVLWIFSFSKSTSQSFLLNRKLIFHFFAFLWNFLYFWHDINKYQQHQAHFRVISLL